MRADGLLAFVKTVDRQVKILQIGQVGRVEPLDDLRRDGFARKIPQASDDPGEDQDHDVSTISADAGILQERDLIPGAGEAHGPFAVDLARRIRVTHRQSEDVLGLRGK